MPKRVTPYDDRVEMIVAKFRRMWSRQFSKQSSIVDNLDIMLDDSRYCRMLRREITEAIAEYDKPNAKK